MRLRLVRLLQHAGVPRGDVEWNEPLRSPSFPAEVPVLEQVHIRSVIDERAVEGAALLGRTEQQNLAIVRLRNDIFLLGEAQHHPHWDMSQQGWQFPAVVEIEPVEAHLGLILYFREPRASFVAKYPADFARRLAQDMNGLLGGAPLVLFFHGSRKTFEPRDCDALWSRLHMRRIEKRHHGYLASVSPEATCDFERDEAADTQTAQKIGPLRLNAQDLLAVVVGYVGEPRMKHGIVHAALRLEAVDRMPTAEFHRQCSVRQDFAFTVMDKKDRRLLSALVQSHDRRALTGRGIAQQAR